MGREGDQDTHGAAALQRVRLPLPLPTPAASRGLGSGKHRAGRIDINGDGSLDRSEIAALAIRLGKALTEAQLDQAMGEMDTDGDGEVDADEFEAWWGEIGDSGTVFSGQECLAAEGS